MYDLPSIIAQNHRAAKLGLIKAGEGVGSEGVAPVPVVVRQFGSLEVLARESSAAIACAKFRQEQKNGEVEIVDEAEHEKDVAEAQTKLLNENCGCVPCDADGVE